AQTDLARQGLQARGLLQARDLGAQQADPLAVFTNVALDAADLGALPRSRRLGDIDREDQRQHAGHADDLDAAHAAHLPLEQTLDRGGDSDHAPLPFIGPQVGACVRTAARILAERARGLAASSASPASRAPLNSRSKLGLRVSTATGAWREPPGALPVRSVRKALTMRSSSEWKVTTTSRPPGASVASAASSPRSSSPNSSLTAMRRAWNTRVAGWMAAPRRPPRAFSTTSARSRVRVKGCSTRRRRMAVATRPDWRSSRYSLKIWASGPWPQVLTMSAAVSPSSDMRMSSGPSRMKEKPRSAWSSCMDETPISKTAPSSLALPLSSNASARPEKGVRISWKRSGKSRATASAKG